MTPIRTPVTAEQLAADVAAEAIRELEEASKKIRHCVEQLDAAVGEAIGALSRITAADLLAMRPIQGFDVTGLAAIFHTLPHFRGHTQEIVHISRTLLGDRYKFAWTPRTPEQGASV